MIRHILGSILWGALCALLGVVVIAAITSGYNHWDSRVLRNKVFLDAVNGQSFLMAWIAATLGIGIWSWKND